jgi:positive regulator of sigma E activity|tara:strand:+ start:557 stop:817 length:261 start_codon:yes stop_codon:yes gene_type:complete
MKEEDRDREQRTPYGTTMADTTMEMFAPNKMLVESATMIFIISFMLLITSVMLWKGPSMDPTFSMVAIFGVFFTFFLAVRQYAAFR